MTKTDAPTREETHNHCEMLRAYIRSTNQEDDRPCGYGEILEIIDQLHETILAAT